MEKKPDAVLCQGEYTLTYAIISRLKLKGIKVVASCSERKAESTFDGERTIKKIIFNYSGFREYM